MPDTATVSDIMTTEVITLGLNDKLEKAVEFFGQYNLDGFPVIREGRKLVGLLTSYDMVFQSSRLHLPVVMSSELSDKQSINAHFGKIGSMEIGEIMNSDPLVVGPEVKVEDLAREFVEHHRVNIIPVVDGERNLLGVVNRYDVIKFFNESHFEKVIKDASHEGVLRRLTRLDE